MAITIRTTLIGALLALCSPARAQTIRVGLDQRAEVIAILFRLAGASDFRDGSVQPYIRQIDSAFAPFRNHPVFADIGTLRRDPGLRLSAVIGIAPQITDPIAFGERIPFDSPASMLGREWHGAAARGFLSDARDFARVANLAGFLRARQPLYDSVSARMRRVADSRGHLEWIGKFFAAPPSDVLVVSPMLANGPGNFGAEFRDGATHERYAFVGVLAADSLGFPVPPPDVLATAVHEFSHTFVNQVVDARGGDLRAAGERIFAVIGHAMSAQAYDAWPTMFNESVVRVAVIRYLLDTDGKAAADRETRLQRGAGFVWMDELVALFDDYESNRARYPSLAAFMPRIVAYYNALAPRVDTMVARYEKHRPRVVAASIADGATNVDPALATLVLRFDQPVESPVYMVGDFGSRVPVITASAFDSTHTVLTLGIRLGPGRDYVVPLGPGSFATRDGYPLQNYLLRFRTTSR